jgi:hypothetical protein
VIIRRFAQLREEPVEAMIERILWQVTQEPSENGILLGKPSEYWWDYWPTAVDVRRVNAQGIQEPTTIPLLQIVIATKGVLLGPEHNVFFFMSTDMVPNEDLLFKGFRLAMKNLHEQRAAQQNGIPPAGTNLRKIKDQPQA